MTKTLTSVYINCKVIKKVMYAIRKWLEDIEFNAERRDVNNKVSKVIINKLIRLTKEDIHKTSV